MQQTLYVLTGLPYSGKTTLTKELVKRFGFKAVSMDDVMDEFKFNSQSMTQDDWNLVYSTAYENLKRFLRQGYSVVLDCGNLPRSERETPKLIAENMNIPSKLIYINVPMEEIIRRYTENEKTKTREQLSAQTLNTAIAMFEEPGDDEAPVLYNQNVNFEEWVKSNILTQ